MIQTELYLITKTRFKNEEDIQDAMQETMIANYKNIHKLKEAKYFKTWMIRILLNKCNKIYQRNKRKEVFLEENANKLSGQEIPEEQISFEMLISHLNKKEQTIFTLYYCFHYTTKEISKLLKIKENTIRTKIVRAKEKLKRNFAKK